MKKILIPVLMLFTACSFEEQERRAQFEKYVEDKFNRYDSAHAWTNSRLDDIEQEQAFVYKDLSYAIPKLRQHDSLILKKEFKRDTWGKIGAFGRGFIFGR